MFPFGKKKANRRRPSKAGDTPRKPLFSRTNAAKNIDYDYSSASTFSDEPSVLRGTRSLDLSPAGYSTENSFRIGGSIDGEVEELYSRLGLSGPEGFAIDAAEWEASLKTRSALDSLRPSRFINSDSLLACEIPAAAVVVEETRVVGDVSDGRSRVTTSIPLASVIYPLAELTSSNEEIRVKPVAHSVRSGGRWDGGIKGTRPPVLTPPSASLLSTPLISSTLAPPPSRALLIEDRVSSTWDIVKSMAPEDENEEGGRRRSLDSELSEDEEEEEEEEEEEGVEDGGGGEVLERSLILAETTDGAGSFSTTNDDDSSSTTTELVISPNLRFRKQIKSWMRGQLLGSGSFGTVYEGISDDGTFIAIKEVSLLDTGINAQQCILQLEQEIALLSLFEHENIVQYYGTSKEESKLVIFLELVTQGSLASLYQKYHLRDTQVSAYTKQILNGLNYLHERNVVHRDIKCANILVHANGSVKLADFGLAKEISKFSELKSCKGSVYWMAPEVVRPRKTYGSAADIWSLGCTVLELLTRQIPYPNVEWQRAFFKIGKGEQPPIPDHLSSEAKDFIRKCVQVDPNTRPTAAQLFDHPFITRRPLQAISL